jgi:hypothetical protein
MATISLLIGGKRRQAAKGATFERRNPLDGSRVPGSVTDGWPDRFDSQGFEAACLTSQCGFATLLDPLGGRTT